MTITDLPDLDEFLAGDEPDYDLEPDTVHIDRATAERYVRRVAKLDADHAAETAAVQAEIDRLQQWLAGRYETYAAQRGWLTGVLRRFHEAILSVDPKAKTLHLPSGDLKMRVQQDALTVDGEQFIPWATEHRPDTLREIPATVAVDLRTVRAALVNGFIVDADGEVAPGVTVEEREPKFTVDVAREDDEAEVGIA